MAFRIPYPHLVIGEDFQIRDCEGKVDEWENYLIYYSFNSDPSYFIPQQFEFCCNEQDFAQIPYNLRFQIKALGAGRVNFDIQALRNVEQLFLHDVYIINFLSVLQLTHLWALSLSNISQLPDLRPLQLMKRLRFVAFDSLCDTRYLPKFGTHCKIFYCKQISSLAYYQRMLKCEKPYNITQFLKEDFADEWHDIRQLKKPDAAYLQETNALLRQLSKHRVFQVQGVHMNIFAKYLEIVSTQATENTVLLETDELDQNYVIPLVFPIKVTVAQAASLRRANASAVLAMNLCGVDAFNFEAFLNLRQLLCTKCSFDQINSLACCQRLETCYFTYCHYLQHLACLDGFSLQLLNLRGCEKLEFAPIEMVQELKISNCPLLPRMTYKNARKFGIEQRILREDEELRESMFVRRVLKENEIDYYKRKSDIFKRALACLHSQDTMKSLTKEINAQIDAVLKTRARISALID